MKKTLLCSGLLALLSASAFAIQDHPATANYPKRTLEIAANKPTNTNIVTAEANITGPTTTTPAPVQQNPATAPANPQPVVTPQPATPAPVNCSYRTGEASHIDPNLVKQWTEKATQQAFDLDFSNLTQQLSALQTCFTDQGWQSFSDALEKSGNMKAITTEKLTVSSIISGTTSIIETKENQWKVNLPLQVVYQNDKEKLTQNLSVDVIVGRKLSGDLGIMQIIATPKTATPAAPAAPATAAPATQPTAPATQN
ncbi:DotI/IcmL family type IV secretion protein [Legionella dresdenensis]|uniref:DotI/IcmL family type IV secretion protein n=1 Tax=Legionella dresdenensis TaxID=450200 RepID=A0ABV8CHU8_9GAMM